MKAVLLALSFVILAAGLALRACSAHAASVGAHPQELRPTPTCAHPASLIEQQGREHGGTEARIEGEALTRYVANGRRMNDPGSRIFFSWADDAVMLLAFEFSDFVAAHLVDANGCSIAVTQMDKATHHKLMSGLKPREA